jgi:CheY-like chemotaxis protein
MSRIHAEELQIKKERFSVNDIMLSLFKNFSEEKQELELNKIELILNTPDEDYFLYTDLIRFKQVISKLIGNAFKYTETGKIEFGYKPIFKTEFEKEPSLLQFEVSDTGIGIPQEKLDYIFSGFNKIDTDRSKLYRGAGLGLFISKNLVELMGGQIWVNSKLNKGSTFHFSLPYFETGDQKTRTQKKKITPEKKSSITYNWQNRTILIVEDELNNIAYLSQIFKRTGITIIVARNGLQAVDAVKKNHEINLVLMDLMMPEMDGYEATGLIKELRPNLPVIAQTAYTLPREKEKILKAGCEGFIYKPYNPPELLALITNFM